MLFQKRPMPSWSSPQVRRGSPTPGCSTLMTSAPNSPNAVATIGPAASVAASITRRPSSGRCGSATVGGGGALKTQMLAQRRPGVAIPEHTTALELGHDQADDVLVGARRVRRGDNEAVARTAVEPRLHLVGDVGPGPDEARTLQQRGPVPRQVGELHGVAAGVRADVLDEAPDAR